MIPSIGCIVHYTLTDSDVEQIARRRADASNSLEWHRENKTGAQIHVGNPVSAGDVYPLLITRVWSDQPNEHTSVNGQVFLDGNDSLWVTSVDQGVGERKWFEPPRVPAGS